MKNCLMSLWNDERGFLVSTELILIATILVIGLIAGMACLQQAIVQEFNDLSWAISSLNQSYRTNSYFGCKGAFSGGSAFFGNNYQRGYAAVGYGNGYGASYGYGYGAGYGGGYSAGGGRARVLYNDYGADLGPCVDVSTGATTAPSAAGTATGTTKDKAASGAGTESGAKQPVECPPAAGVSPYVAPVPLHDGGVNLPCHGCNSGETAVPLAPQPTAPSQNPLPSPPSYEGK